MEARFFAYSFNNLNRGFNSVGPWGYLDGVGVENRWYLTWNDIYDVPRQSFLSLGYFPSKDMIGQDKEKFQPSLFARAYLTYDLRPKTWFVYSDIQYICERPLRSRLWFFNQGFAIRPFERFRGTELRVGCETTWDVKANRSRPLIYTATYVNF